ncbi:MAG: Asp-tRNA(Asn)/Glu-tRNA(Gln) amidotransferase subunit GatB, partial [Mucilaginibacter sp.]|uniref:Asp-tRNA(Asn)/Glu-tRNA(Gln) amidotransferase subunit GatB n=1 Tax=Mucilaginibacter sp. TaxID=1882438 RepID=UPI0035626650
MAVLQSGVSDKYELVVGLEVHAQLSTLSKAFSSDSAAFGAEPNHHVSPVSLGHPGTLPRINKKMVEYAIKMGLACNCSINLNNTFARKNYFYADLPKGYQTTQDQQPICLGGGVTVKLADGTSKTIAIHHIHMEDDAGKSSHDQHDHYSLIDLNRAGVPLIEIVSEPDLRSAEEAGQFLTEIRRLLRYLDICDGNMEEGSMRCDANISVRLRGAAQYGNRCEVKNLNSIRNVQRAIEHEFARQVEVIENGGRIDQNTLNFNADTGETSVLRSKEMANDYRYFPEPDLMPVQITEAQLAAIRSNMPALPNQLFEKYTQKLGLSDYDAGVIIADKEFAAYFEELIKHTANYKSAANW